MRNHGFDAFKNNSYFWPENVGGRHADAKCLWPQDPTKKLAIWVDLLVKPLSQKLFRRVITQFKS